MSVYLFDLLVILYNVRHLIKTCNIVIAFADYVIL